MVVSLFYNLIYLLYDLIHSITGQIMYFLNLIFLLFCAGETKENAVSKNKTNIKKVIAEAAPVPATTAAISISTNADDSKVNLIQTFEFRL